MQPSVLASDLVPLLSWVGAFCSHAVCGFIPSSADGACPCGVQMLGFAGGVWVCSYGWVDSGWVHTSMHMGVMTLFGVHLSI